jgi:hypothetical protein
MNGGAKGGERMQQQEKGTQTCSSNKCKGRQCMRRLSVVHCAVVGEAVDCPVAKVSIAQHSGRNYRKYCDAGRNYRKYCDAGHVDEGSGGLRLCCWVGVAVHE